jgi:CubicO group peptidase (beta-lactamase class C family)
MDTKKAQFAQMPEKIDIPQSDPKVSQIMVGFPPPVEKQVRFSERTALTFPKLRWSLSHWRELAPTKRVWRGPGPAVHLPKREDGKSTSFTEAIDQMFTDGLIILHKGDVVFETYRGEGDPHLPHMSFSITKSIIGLIAWTLVAEGELSEDALVTKFVAELAGSALEGATVKHVLDMTVGIRFSENYPDPDAEIRGYGAPSGLGPTPMGYEGPRDLASYLPTLKATGTHGEAFTYATPLADVLSWILSRATGKSFTTLLTELIWSKLGAEEDASINVDPLGAESAGTGFSATLRDMARFGEMIRRKGEFGGRRVLPSRVFDGLIVPGDTHAKQTFAKSGYEHLAGWTYRNMWWVANNPNGAFHARGIFGQALFIDPTAEIVLARFSSMPTVSSSGSDPLCLPFYDAVVRHLQSNQPLR